MQEIKPQEVDIDKIAMDIFNKALDIAGGPRKLIKYRNLTWVPALIESAYTVLHEEQKKTEREIAEFLGITEQSVKNILRANVEEVEKRLSEYFEEEETKVHTHIAGGLAKMAYQKYKEAKEAA